MLTHTNNCIAHSVVDSLSTLERFPEVIGTVTRDEAIVAYRACTKCYKSISKAVWFLTDGVAYRVTNGRYELMSFYNN